MIPLPPAIDISRPDRSPPALADGFLRFLGALAAAGSAATDVTVENLRTAAAATRRPWNAGGPAMHAVETAVLDTPAGRVRIRACHPSSGRSAATLVYLHGGGWTLLGIETHDRIMREYAAASGWTVIGLDFPLAPEAPFPVALRACVAAIRQLAATERGPLVLAGDSSGANLALAAALALRDERADVIDGLVLHYGVYDCDLTRASYAAFGRPPYTLSAEKMGWFWRQYCPDDARRSDPLASPLRADLAGLPPVRLVTAGRDVLRDENLALASRLAEAGNAVTLDHYPDAPHAFLEALAFEDLGLVAIRRASAWLNDVLRVPETLA
jgi:acetyl esterase